MTSRRLLAMTAALLTAGPAAHAAAPAPYDPVQFAFPGSVRSPGDAASAGLAGADGWLTWAPGGNPATAPPSASVTLSPLLQRVSRQDLSAANSEFSETSAFLDAAGAQIALRRAHWGLRLEVSQPVLRRETSTFSRSIGDGVSQPARLKVDAESREQRAGLALSRGMGAWRLGAAAELTRRDDRYATTEVSGSPESGIRELTFDGSSVGGSVGALWSRSPGSKWGTEVGAAMRFIGALDGTSRSVSDLLAGLEQQTGDASREATWEAGASARLTVDPRGGHAWLTLEQRSAERWPGLQLEAEAASSWRAGYSYRDERTPWSVRVGIGQDVQPGTPEPRATAVGLGVGWRQDDFGVDLGVTHRSIRRGELPTQGDTRVVASIIVGL